MKPWDEQTVEPECADGVQPRRRLLVLDTSFTLEMIRERRLESSVTCRDLGGYFEHVWTVHPFATLLTSPGWTSRTGPPVNTPIALRHTFIEGKVGRFRFLRRFPRLNFVLAQAGIVRHLVRLIREEEVDVIRAGNALYLGLLGLLLARVCRVPLVLRIGENSDKIFEATGAPAMPKLIGSRRVEKVIERFVFPRADLVAGANQDNLDFAIANGADPKRGTVFRYGNLIDPLHFADPSIRPGADEDLMEFGLSERRFILYIGRLVEVKRPDHVIEVTKRLREDGKEVVALLAGDGSMRPKLTKLARDLGVNDAVVFCGNRDQGWLARVLPRAAAVISPHTGRALAEAALSGAAVAAYDVDWQSEIVEDGITGLLVPNLDVAALAEAVKVLLDDHRLAETLGRRLRERALEMMDPVRLDAHEREEYDRLFAGEARR